MKEYSRLNSQLVPISHDLRQWAGGVDDQKSTNSCVANAITSGLELILNRAGRPAELSRLFLYYNARALSHVASEVEIDGGSRPYYAVTSIPTFGVPNESDYPFDLGVINTKPSADVYVKAKEGNRTHLDVETITLSYPINWATGALFFDTIKSAISEGFPVAIQLHASDSIWEQSGPLDDHRYQSCFTNPERYQGIDHEMLVVGYTEKYLILENSYGEQTGHFGYHALDKVGCCDIVNAYVLRAFDGYTDLVDRATVIRQPYLIRDHVNALLTQNRVQEIIDASTKFCIDNKQLEYIMGWPKDSVLSAYNDTKDKLDWSKYPWAPTK